MCGLSHQPGRNFTIRSKADIRVWCEELLAELDSDDRVLRRHNGVTKLDGGLSGDFPNDTRKRMILSLSLL